MFSTYNFKQYNINCISSFPVWIQFATFSLLLLFFAYVVHRQEWLDQIPLLFCCMAPSSQLTTYGMHEEKRWYEFRRRNIFWVLYVLVNLATLVFFIIYMTLSSVSEKKNGSPMLSNFWSLFLGILLFAEVIGFAYYALKIRRMANNPRGSLHQLQLSVSSGMGRTNRQQVMRVLIVVVAVTLIFTTRLSYDFAVLFMNHNPINLDISTKKTKHEVLVSLTFLFFDALPTVIILLFFNDIPRRPTGGRSARLLPSWLSPRKNDPRILSGIAAAPDDQVDHINGGIVVDNEGMSSPTSSLLQSASFHSMNGSSNHSHNHSGNGHHSDNDSPRKTGGDPILGFRARTSSTTPISDQFYHGGGYYYSSGNETSTSFSPGTHGMLPSEVYPGYSTFSYSVEDTDDD